MEGKLREGDARHRSVQRNDETGNVENNGE
jgi:hypothetical protein